MFRINGFYSYVKHHGLRSVALMGMFVIASQIVGIVLLLVPVIFLDIENNPITNPFGYLIRYGVGIFLVSGLMFLFAYFLQNRGLQSNLGLTEASPHLHPRLFRAVSMLSQTAGIPVPGLLILPSHRMNAFATRSAFEAPSIVVTQGLYQNLDDQELEAVLAHEIAHIANDDPGFMAIANAATAVVERMYNFSWLGRLKYLALPFVVMMPLLLLLYFLVVKLKLFGRLMALSTRLLISSSREYIADAEAVRLTHNPAALVSALKKLQNRSRIEGLNPLMEAMMIDGESTGQYATHPTISERIAQLVRLSGSMVHDRGFVTTSAHSSAAFGVSTPGFGSRPMDPGYAMGQTTAYDRLQVNDYEPPVVPKRVFDRVSHGANKPASGFAGISFKNFLKYSAYGYIALSMLSMVAGYNTMRRMGVQMDGMDHVSNEISPQPKINETNFFLAKRIVAGQGNHGVQPVSGDAGKSSQASAKSQVQPASKSALKIASKPSPIEATTPEAKPAKKTPVQAKQKSAKGDSLSVLTIKGRKMAVLVLPGSQKKIAVDVGEEGDNLSIMGSTHKGGGARIKNLSTGKVYYVNKDSK